jgi:hypothetical protein
VTLGPRAVLAGCAAALVGCAGEPQPRIDAIDPAQAYTDRDMRLMLIGSDFIPSFRLDPVSGERVAIMEGFSGRVGSDPNWEPLTNFGWVSPTQISAGLARDDAEDLPVRLCDVEITDPRGRQAVLQGRFSALGRDPPPTLTFTSPVGGEIYAPGSSIHASVTATDKPPGHLTELTWTYTEPSAEDGSQRQPVTGFCPCEPGSDHIDCAFDVTISTDLDPNMTVNLNMVAQDDAVPPNQISQDIPPIRLSERPTVSSVTPPSGGVAGGTNVLIQGSGFVAGSRVYFGNSLLIPDGGIWVNAGTITGYTPAHIAGSASVIVQSRLGFAEWNHKFDYHLPPQIASISPSFGIQGEDTQVQVLGTNFTTATIIYLGQTLAGARPLARTSWQSDEEIRGVVPSSSGQATVWAFDVNNGWTSLPNGFSWIVP